MKRNQKEFKKGTAYLYGGKRYKVLEATTKAVLLAPFKGFCVSRDDAFTRSIRRNRITGIQQLNLGTKNCPYNKTWMRATDVAPEW